MESPLKTGDEVSLNALFDTYDYGKTYVNETKVYDNKTFHVKRPQREEKYKVVIIYGSKTNKNEQWITLNGISGAYPAKFFDTNTQFCKIKKT